MSRARLLGVALLATMAPAASVAPQAAVVDEGSFTITVEGSRAGREQFRIVSTPGPQGASMIASATVSLRDLRLVPILRTDSTGAPQEYQVETRRGTVTRERLRGSIDRGRASLHVQGPRGESASEFVVSDVLILEDDVFHQYYFLALRDVASRGRVTVLVPRRGIQISLQVRNAGTERVLIAGQLLNATHLALTEPDGTIRDVWVDDARRVLRVELPGRQLVALRDDPPPVRPVRAMPGHAPQPFDSASAETRP